MSKHTLEKELRYKLEQTIKEARRTAEAAAKVALEHLGVGHSAAYSHLTPEEKKLRVRLRAHGRQLGDNLADDQTQETGLLTEEAGYQHWHRMLFAHFLAENGLLMDADPDSPIAVTLEECNELAADDPEVRNGWELAARYAAQMLPQIFRTDSPVFALHLPIEYQQKLEVLLEALPPEVFTATDSLGWVYQYWQSHKKEEVNASEVKIGARELPAVTQLFTEPYMVSFLLNNSLGAWWGARRLTADDLNTAGSEEELRQKAALDGVPLENLRFVREDNGPWAPAAGTFDQWPEHLSELKMMDPCCGSGHFIVSTFQMLVPMRMELEGLGATEAVDKVIGENIHGLEIDQRCVEIAAFALAFAAWRYPGTGGYRELPEFNLACSGLSVSVPKATWRKIARDNTQMRLALDVLHDYFRQAPVLGSLLNPSRSEAAMLVEWPDLVKGMERALQKEPTEEEYEAGVAASGLAKVANLLSMKFNLIITNVPYLSRSKQNKTMMDYCDIYHSLSKYELGYVFLERFLNALTLNGCIAVVQPQNLLYMERYKRFREYLLLNYNWIFISCLGSRAFETISGEVVNVGLFIFENNEANDDCIFGLEVSEHRNPKGKSIALKTSEIYSIAQQSIVDRPNNVFSFNYKSTDEPYLEKLSECYQGLKTGDSIQFIRRFWEIKNNSSTWDYLQTSSDNFLSFYSGYTQIILWDEGYGKLHKFARENRTRLHDMHESGNRVWGKKGIALGQMNLKTTVYMGDKYESLAVIVPYKEEYIKALYSFLQSETYTTEIKTINRGLFVTNAAIVKVPFDLAHWQKVAEEKYPHGLPAPFSDDPTQWIFHGHPCGSVVFNEQTGLLEHGPIRTDHTVLQVAVARLLGYRWPAENDPAMELSNQSRAWVDKCKAFEEFTDREGIVCIPAVRGEAAATDRLINLLAAAYGNNWTQGTLAQLLKEADHGGKTLETWLRDKFFTQHCKLFHHRPFIWQVWDGQPDGFSALANYHKLNQKNLETLIYTYLGDWIKRQKQDLAGGIDGAAERIAAAENLKKTLMLILEGEAPYDIFVRWKPVEKQPIGWDPDLNDGVRLNIRPFLLAPPVRKKGAGVLRDKPNIKLNKDRGKDLPSAHWFHLFKGDRINEHHLKLSEKKDARGPAQTHSLAAEEEQLY